MKRLNRTRVWPSVTLFAILLSTNAPSLGQPLPTDERLETGTLANGLTWIVRQHDNPPGQLSLMLHVRSGSLNEDENERGLAHFIQHMCFHGSENFPPGNLVTWYESNGMEFGPDLNAFTGFDQTAYMVFTQQSGPQNVEEALMVLSDYAFRVSFMPEQVDRERRVLLKERVEGQTSFQRVRDKLWPQLFAGSRFANHLPVGDAKVITEADRGQLEKYYKTWYRPERMTLIVVGDVQSENVLPMIERWFSEEAPAAALPEPKSAELTPFASRKAFVVTDPEVAGVKIQMMKLREGRPVTTTKEQWRQDLVESVAAWIMSQRFKMAVQAGEAPFSNASVSLLNFFNSGLLVSVSAEGTDQPWRPMLERVITEIKRTRDHLFTLSELNWAKYDITTDAQKLVREEGERESRAILFDIASAVNDNKPIMSLLQEYKLYRELLQTIRIDELDHVFRDYFSPGAFAYVVIVAESDGVTPPTSEEVLAVVNETWEKEIEPLPEQLAPRTLLETPPTPGSIVESSLDEEFGVTSLTLSNGVRVHHRFMEQANEFVFVTVSLAGGTIEETADNAGVTQAAAIVINEPSTSRHSRRNIYDIQHGKFVQLRAHVSGMDTFEIRVQSTRTELGNGLEQLYLLLTDGRVNSEAFEQWQQQTRDMAAEYKKSPRYAAAETMERLLSDGDSRLAFWSKERVDRLTVDMTQAWFDRLSREAPIEVSVVGSISLDELKPLLEKYVASLPKRSRDADHLDRYRTLRRIPGPREALETVVTDGSNESAEAMVAVGFVGCDGRETSDRRALDLAAHVLQQRLDKRLREEMGLVKSIRAVSQASFVMREAGRFVAGAPCAPSDASKLADEIRGMMSKLTQEGPNDVELAEAKKQLAQVTQDALKEVRYWSALLSQLDMHGRSPREDQTETEALQVFSASQVRDVLRKYDVPERQFRVIAIPQSPPDAGTVEDAETPQE